MNILSYRGLLLPHGFLLNQPHNHCHHASFEHSKLNFTKSATPRHPLPNILCSTAHNAANELDSEAETPTGKGAQVFWVRWKIDTADLSSQLAKLGFAAVLAYGLFDAVTYTSFFVMAFLGYEKSTGKNPAANLQALLGIIILMWTGNNVTRPFRVAGAAALAPLIDRGLKKIQRYFKIPSPIYAFVLVVASVASCCFTVIALFILSRWGK